MNLNEILNGNQNAMDKYVSFLKGQTSFSRGAGRITNGRYSLKRLKMEAGDLLMVVPVMIHLPIDRDGTMLSEPMPYIGSFETAIKLIKYLANSNTIFADGLKEIMGDSYNALDFSSNTVSTEERKAFWRYRKPLVYERTVMAVKAANSQNPFGTPYAVNIAVDPDTKEYIDSPNNPLIWTLYKLEAAGIASQVKELREENEAAGAKRRTDQEVNETIKNMWKQRIITNPYPLGTSRVLAFKADKDHEIIADVKKNWTPDMNGIRASEYYIKVNKKIVDNFNGQLFTKFDRYDDFLLINQNTPAFQESERGTAAQNISRTPAGSDDKIEDQLKEFIKTYAEYRDNMESWDEKIIKASAFEYRTISDENILKIFKESMGPLSAAVKSKEIYEKFGEVISQLDPALSDELMSSMLGEGLKSTGDLTNELKSAPAITENTPGYGGDDIGDVESDSQAMLNALTAD